MFDREHNGPVMVPQGVRGIQLDSGRRVNRGRKINIQGFL